MLTDVAVEEQLEAVRKDPIRVLVVGAGVAGLTLTGQLRRRGLHPVLVERSRAGADTGYMIALFPLVDPAIEALGVEKEYEAASVPLRRYLIRDRHGDRIREYSLRSLVDALGDYRGLDRGALLDVLSAHGGAVTHETTVSALRQGTSSVTATMTTASKDFTGEFDLVVVADGLHSSTRRLVLRDEQVSTLDTKWGGWVAWAEEDGDPDLGEEIWGAGFFIGTYPVKGRVGVFVGGPRSEAESDRGRFVARVRSKVTADHGRMHRALRAVEADGAYFWSLTDCRSRTWSAGRVLLLGDAAAGFLPTAGIGAGMAMESAWVFGTMLEGASRERVPVVLNRFEEQQRPRVEAAQQNSRQLAKLMFHESNVLAFVRDQAARFVTLDTALGPIRRLIHDRPHPKPLAGAAGM